MKNTLFLTFRILIGIVLIAKISTWFIQYSDETNKLITAAMFTLIGIAYLVGGFIWKKKSTNIIYLVCGTYLIAMNFFNDFALKSMIGIVCMLTPILITRFLPETDDEKELTAN